MSTLSNLWLKWKSLRLPWRRTFLAGRDLHGNTYWEFRSPSSPTRMRRIVKAASGSHIHHSDIQALVSPLWHQWLRHTRADAPSMQEQEGDVMRQIQLKEGARLADARWESKKRYIETPAREKDEGVTGTRGHEAQRRVSEEVRRGMERGLGGRPEEVVGDVKKAEQKPDPWEVERQKQKNTASNPGGGFQPEAWTPPPRRR
ncbi:hypothetical protein OHC33_001817 [Knufia fluminis]|uniref:NADH dehydrogenase [ubiquinone] 1 alpha subcomplex subunit n=1 Tax=Knufia fluminis TaxID=191047 RepID=A0AAN8ERS9_9EURO|nr:hypothetical protein OHC33_001817 [Knufia fluminis]